MSEEIILARGSGSGEDALAIGNDARQNIVPAVPDAIDGLEDLVGGEIAKVQEVVGLLDVFHDPIDLGIKRDGDNGGLRNKSENGAVQAAGNEVIGLAKDGDKFTPGFDHRKMDLAVEAGLQLVVETAEEIGDDAFVVAERGANDDEEKTLPGKRGKHLGELLDVVIVESAIRSGPAAGLGVGNRTEGNHRAAVGHGANGVGRRW